MRSVPTLFVPSENAMVYTNQSCFNGSIKLDSPLKIGGTDARSKSRGQTCLDYALREGGRLSKAKVKTSAGGEGV